MIIPFASQSYRHDSLPLSAQRALNLYAERQPPDAKSQVAVFGSPGIITWAAVGTGPIRGFHSMADTLYVVSGAFLWSVSNAAVPVATQLGGQVGGSGVVKMDDNGDEIAIADGTNGFIYSAASGFRQIVDGDFHAANTVAHLDGFFLWDRKSTNEFFSSDLLDGMTYDSTKFATAESKSDNVVTPRALKKILYVFGTASIEPWANAGAANLPFQPVPGGTIGRGIIAPHAVTDEDDALFFIGDDRVAYRLSGSQISRISTHAIERAWQEYATVTDAFGMVYNWKGHKFPTFTFPTQGATWSYDIATQLWHERESRDRTGIALGRWRANCAISVYNKIMIGDVFSNKIGYLSDDVTTEFDDRMDALAVGTVLHNGRKRAFMSCFELDMETGVGITTGQGSDPQVMMRTSDDGGRTWSPQQPWQSLGKIGEYTKRLRWKRQGNFFQRAIEITISDPVRRVIIAASADMK